MFPQPFIEHLIKTMGEKSASVLLETMEQKPPVTIRVNPVKVSDVSTLNLPINEEIDIPFSGLGVVLKERPNFTLDPSFQAGAYYVQEASSMSIELVRPLIQKMGNRQPGDTIKVLDLCASPGGKSTHILSMLCDIPSSFLVSNEVIRARTAALAGNIVKWGASNVLVTNNDPADFHVLPSYFDVIFVDAPCSGEGMFRKDSGAVSEWSPENVKICAARQRRILSDIWGSLKDGGILVYSTCTFNTTENDDNVAWLALSYGAEPLATQHLYPGKEYGEGFFFSILRKHGEGGADAFSVPDRRKDAPIALKQYKQQISFLADGYRVYRKGDLLKAYPESVCDDMIYVEQKLRTLSAGTAIAAVLEGAQNKGVAKGDLTGAVASAAKGGLSGGAKGDLTLIPEPDLALSEVLRRGVFPEEELFDPSASDPQWKALKYLRKEPITFPDAPNGYILLTWLGIPLGFVKKIGNRCNNLWPQGWRIRQ